MPNRIVLEIGNTIAVVPIRLTNAQANAVIGRYTLAKGIPTEGRTAQQIGEDVLRSLLRTVRDVSLTQQRQELLAEQQAALEATLTVDNELFDEPEP